jgi:pilus assembly protein CpaF
VTPANRLIVSNNILGGSEEVLLDSGRELVIGRPSEAGEQQADILLRSKLVSRRHAILSRHDGAWQIKHCGSTDTIINGHPLAFGQSQQLTDGDQIIIGEYLLRIVSEVPGKRTPLEDQYAEQIMQIEHEIHSRLLDLMDLRQSRQQIDLENEATRLKIREFLDSLVDDAVKSISSELRLEIVKTAVLKRLTWTVTFAGGDSSLERPCKEFEQPFFEAQLSEVCTRIIHSLGVSLEPSAMKDDLRLLEAGFAAAFAGSEIDFSDAMQDYVAGTHFTRNILDLIFGLGPLQDLLDTPTISEIMVVSRDRIFVEKFGVVEDARRSFFNDQLLMSVIERIVSPVGRRIDKSNPLVDARLKDGSRVNAIIPPLAIKGPCLTIRKFSQAKITIDDLVRFGALTSQMREFLRACVDSHLNVVVSGGTGSGKTTMLNSLSAFISPAERVVTIEDTAELQLKQEHVVPLETRPPNMEGKGEVTMRDLIKNALRMRPDRIIVGECRGGETLDMLQAMNTGHDGSMTTGHANTPQDMMKTLGDHGTYRCRYACGCDSRADIRSRACGGTAEPFLGWCAAYHAYFRSDLYR